MSDDAKQIIKELAIRLWVLPIGDYLASAEFLRFCREQDLGDAWKESLERSRDIPDLYGSAVTRNAFILFLHHIFHSRPGDFLVLFTRLLADFSRGISCDIPVDEIRSFLKLLGYPEDKIDHALFILRMKQEPAPEPSDDCCPAQKK